MRLVNKKILTFLLFITTVNLLFALCLDGIIPLSENQILYIFSSIAQLVGALLGITLAVYPIVDSKFRAIGEQDVTATDFSNEIRDDAFCSLVVIFVLSVSSIILSLIILATYFQLSSRVIGFLMNQVGIIFVALIVAIFIYVCSLNPGNIKQKGSKEKGEIEENYKDGRDNTSLNFQSFIIYYNFLDDLLNKYASLLLDKTLVEDRFRFSQALNILREYKVISPKMYFKIIELRKYRNALAHSLEQDKYVNSNLLEELKNIYDKLLSAYESFNRYKTEGNNTEKALYERYLKELDSYIVEKGFTKLEKEIIEYISSKDQVEANEIASHLKLSRVATFKTLMRLEEIGVIRRIEVGSKIKWLVV